MMANSNHGDDSLMGLTTPSSTQASSPSASPALSLVEERKRNKSESEDNQSQRNRSNSGVTNTSSIYAPSPKNPTQLQQQSPSVVGPTKLILPTVPTSAPVLSTSAPSHFPYPVATSAPATLPVLQYAAIVSQNTVPSTSTTTTSSNSTLSKQHVLSPQTKQPSRPIVNGTGTGAITNTNDSIVTTTSTLPISSVTTTVTSSSNSVHPPSLLPINNDRTGIVYLFICRFD